MPSMMDLLAMPGETRQLNGFVKRVETVEPDDRARARATKEGYTAKTKHQLVFQPNGLEDRKIKFDTEVYQPSQLATLQGAFATILVDVKQYSFDDGRTGESTSLNKVLKVHLDANGQAPAPK